MALTASAVGSPSSSGPTATKVRWMGALIMETLAADTPEHSIVDAADIRAGSGANAVPKMSDLIAVEPSPGSANPVEEPKSETDLVSKL